MQREQQLEHWITQQFPNTPFKISPASADASFRRYFRVEFDDQRPSLIAMDAPPEHEDCRPFIKIAKLFEQSDAFVPHIYAEDLSQGFLLLTDLGNITYLQQLESKDIKVASRLYNDATDALIKIQLSSQANILPEYDEALLRREMTLFPEWYIQRHLKVELNEHQQAKLETVFQRILANNLAQPKVYVHRDYHSRNLMVCEPNPGIIDFQDAVYGPITYDLVSLFKDAYIYWEEAQVLDWVVRYWEKARAAGLPVAADFGEFYRDYELMGAQRHLKVLGIFARLNYRDGKDGYLQNIPLVMAQLRMACVRYIDLKPLLNIIDTLEPNNFKEGFSF